MKIIAILTIGLLLSSCASAPDVIEQSIAKAISEINQDVEGDEAE